MKRFFKQAPVHKKRHSNNEKYSFIAKKDGFSISFPGTPEAIDTHDYSRQYITKSKDAIYAVTVYDLRESKTARNDMLTEVMHSTSRVLDLLGVGATETRSFEGKADIDGLPSIRLSCETGKGTIYYFAAVVRGNRLYELVLKVHGENDELFEEFVNSFKLES